MNIYLAVLLIVGSMAYILYTSWQMWRGQIVRLVGYGQLLAGLGGLTWGIVAWYPYTPEFTGNVGLCASTVFLIGTVMTNHGTRRQKLDR